MEDTVQYLYIYRNILYISHEANDPHKIGVQVGLQHTGEYEGGLAENPHSREVTAWS
jgi:hypothetical protein